MSKNFSKVALGMIVGGLVLLFAGTAQTQAADPPAGASGVLRKRNHSTTDAKNSASPTVAIKCSHCTNHGDERVRG